MPPPLFLSLFRRSLAPLLAACALATGVSSAAALTVDTLRCEYKDTPLGVDSSQPRLSWVPESQQRGDTITAYQVWVASSASALANGGDLWDSGKVTSGDNQVAYGGSALSTGQQVFWQVRVWNGAGAMSNWSAPASWTMGVLTPSAWTGQWITAARAASGYHDGGSNTATGATKWVQVDLGSTQSITTVRLHPTNNPNLNLPAYGFPVRFKIQMSNDPTFASGVTTVTDQTGADFANPGAAAVAFAASGLARYVRVTATTLFSAPNNNIVGSNYVFSLSQIEVVAGGQNVALNKAVSSADSLERNSEWGQASLTDGLGLVGSRAVTQSDRFRTNFTVASGLKRATVFVCGLGQYEMTLNGTKVGANVLTPNWSNYSKTVYYDTYDVTALLPSGTNAAGVALGNGFYNVNGGRYAKVNCSYGPRRVIAQIRLEYANGSVTTIGTDPTWKWSPGPATFSCIYGGEDVDGRLDAAGWDTASFDSSTWLAAKATTGPTGATLRGGSLNAPSTRVTQTLTPASSKVIGTNSTVYDFGQNASQIPIITVHGTAGSTVKLTMAEYVNGNGTLAPIVSPVSMTYTLKGSGSETFAPKFFYMGYRFMEADLRDPSGNASGSSVPTLDSISSQVVTASPGNAGTFSTSSTLFNNIDTLVYWAQVNNMTCGILSDCPTREKLGWQEETYFNGPALRYNLDMTAQFAKQCNDFIDGQGGNGAMPSVVPSFGGWSDISPEWGSSTVMVPWQQYQFTGDLTTLSRNYASAKAWVNYLGSQVNPSGSYLLNYGLGDWYDLGPNGVGNSQDTPQGLTATATYFEVVQVLAQWARLLGNTADANTYTQLTANIRTAFNSQFLNTSTHTYGVGTFTSGPSAYGSQTSNAMPLALGMVDPANQATVLNAIVNDLAGRGYVVTSGDVGYRYLIRALADNGRSDVLFNTDNRTNAPGYGYILSTGATSMTEAWDASPADSHSLDHFMLGQVMEWFYHDLAGIQSDPANPGFKNIIINPAMVGNLASVNATYRSIRGSIISNWTNGPNGLTMNVTIPAASTATIYVPAANASVVQESGVAASSAPGVQFLGLQGGAAVYAVGSGSYAFSSVATPGAPTALTASAGTNGVLLTWTPPFNATTFNVWRATASGGPYTALTQGITGTSFNDVTVQFGNTYYYVVTAANTAAESAYSNQAGLALTTPAAPAGLTATAGSAVVQLSWTPMAGVSGYRIKRGTASGGPYATTVVSSTPGNAYVDTGLTNGTTYYYTVTALIFTNEGAASAPASAAPAASANPVARATNAGGVSSSNFESTNTNENIAKLFDGSTSTKWYQNAADSGVWIQYQFPNGLAWAVTSYAISSANDVPGRDPAAWQLQASNDGATWTTLDTQTGQTFANRYQTNTYKIANMTAYRYYRLYITADQTPGNGIQMSEFALYSSASDPGDKVPPVLSLPAPITVRATSNNAAVVSFNATASDAVSGALAVSSAPPSGTTFPLGTTTVACAAADAAGNTATGSFTVTVQSPYNAPSGLSATALSESQMRLKWTNNPSGESGYRVESSPAGVGNWTVQTSALSTGASSYTVNGLNASSNYDFRVEATGMAGTSPYVTLTAATPAGVGDGIPGSWRLRYFGDGLSAQGNAGFGADPDGDGMTNDQEYLAGTDPTDPQSALRITALSWSGANLILTFPSVSGKVYQLQTNSTLESTGSWNVAQDNIVGTGGLLSLSVAGAATAPPAFYRISTKP